MHCPQCGQQQVSDEIKFCSKCGLPLGVVYEVLRHGGTLPQLFEPEKSSGWLTKTNGAKFSLVWLLFWCVLLTPLLAVLDGGEIVAVAAILGFVGAIFILVGSLLFLKTPTVGYRNLMPAENMSPRSLHGTPAQTALPPRQVKPGEQYIAPSDQWKAPDTGELVQPGSVTEGTTKLLNQDE